MAKRTIIFRADGGPSIGMGHFTRTLALAEMLNEHFHCVFAARQPTEYQVAEIEKICHGRIDLPEDDSHFEQFLTHLIGNEIVVLDNYYFTTDYQKVIKAKGCKLVCIDDMHDKHYVADVVINHAPLRRDLFSNSIYTRLLIGFDFALLRGDFFQNQFNSHTPHTMNTAFLCMGGADFNNLTSRVLDDLMAINTLEAVIIVVGNAYQYFENLKSKVNDYSKRKKIHLFQNLNAKELINQMNRSDFAIVPCSTILLETVSQKLPILTGYYVENQKEIAKYLKEKYKNIQVIGNLNETKIQQKHINSLKSNNKQSYLPIIDSKVKDRFISVFKSIESEFMIHCRKAEIKDIDTYFLWANDNSVRENAMNPEMIEYDNHVKWYKSKINNKESFLYIFERGNSAIGQVRFDKSDSYYIIDYSVDENFRGKGYGTIILKLGLEQLLKDCKDNKNLKIKAQVKRNNKASCRVFENFNFVNTGMIEIKNNSFVEYEKVVL